MAAIYQTGIDVSRYQGTIDWAAVARAGKQFAVIRAVSSNNSGVYVDPMFEKNYAGAKAAGLRVGVYYYTYAQTESYADRELEALTAVLAGKKLEYPVFVDMEAEGIETELVQAGKTAHACNACASCKKTHRCVYDDLVNETAPKLTAADALVIGSPVYYASPTGGAISFMDRLFFSTPHIDKTMKVGASVVSCRRGGNTATFDALNKYFTICGMPVASSQYWNMVYGNTPEEVRQDKEGLQTMRTLGRNMAFLMKSIALGKEKFGLPETEQRIGMNFIR